MWVGVLSTQILDVQRVQFGSGRVLEQRSPILALALLHPMPVHAERTAVDDLEDAQRIEWIRIVEVPSHFTPSPIAYLSQDLDAVRVT